MTLLIMGLSLNIVKFTFAMDLHLSPVMDQGPMTTSLKIDPKKLENVVKEKIKKEKAKKELILKKDVKKGVKKEIIVQEKTKKKFIKPRKQLIKQEKSILSSKPLVIKKSDIEGDHLHSLSLKLNTFIMSHDRFIVRGGRVIKSCKFESTYTLLQQNPCLQKDLLLGWKLMAVMFKKINSVQDFCDGFIAFPCGTGLMARTFAYFGHNEEFVTDYDKIVVSAKKKNCFLPIVCLVKNRKYHLMS